MNTREKESVSMRLGTSSVNDEVAVGDLNSDAKGSGARKSGGKVKFSLIPLHLLAGVARVLMAGIIKYAHWNWAKGMDWDECYDCTMRHMFKFWYLREDLDQETMEHHIDHAMCNLLFLRHYVMMYPEGDTRPPVSAMFGEEELEFLMTMFDEKAYRKRNNIPEETDDQS